MHNIKTNFDKIIDKIKPFAQNIVNQYGNVPRLSVKPKFSDLEVMALAITVENYFIVDSKPLPVCRFARARRCSMWKKMLP